MAYNSRYNKNVRARNIDCSCGGNAKLSSKKNYPFGKKSKAITSVFYRCNSCNKITSLNKDTGGKR